MTKFWTTLCIVLCLGSLVFSQTHKTDDGALLSDPQNQCLTCHTDYKDFAASAMVTKRDESKFIQSAFMLVDPDFGKKNCSGCHVTSCMDCHTLEKNGKMSLPNVKTCTKCHIDTKIGMDYTGMGIREDHERYQRGININGVYYIRMLPDVHYEKGLQCGVCHTMKSLANDNVSAKQCLDCHTYDRRSVIEHSIKGHDKVTCEGCHAAWTANEYGTFYIRLRETGVKNYYRWVKQLGDEYAKSSVMRLNTPFALGINEKGQYAPIRPNYIVFFTNVFKDFVVGRENDMLANRWKVVRPHTIRKETVLCDACHYDRRKYLLETEEQRYLMLEKDGLAIGTFYNSKHFRLDGGRFVTEEEYEKISEVTNQRAKYYIKKYEQVRALIRGQRGR